MAAGVLLYYKYAKVSDISALVDFYESDCNALGLLGRVRIAPDGVNATIGGKMSALEKHIDRLKSMSLFDGTDFKLASCDHPSNEKIAKECGFTTLSIRVVKELVTFRSDPLLKSPEISKAGRHLSATEFHYVLQDAGNTLDSKKREENKELILLDARNMYETRIGKFQASNVETLDPEIRQYSDLPAWVDKYAEKLRGKSVLMYCTGGIRCEMASAYIRSKGTGFENVFQLYGGIQRYLEKFPDGGFFKGKNFVFDHRISVGSENADILGTCFLCGSSYDDYSPRCRCAYCRMLVLVCDNCKEKPSAGYVCELCQKTGKAIHHESLLQPYMSRLELHTDSLETLRTEALSATDCNKSFSEPSKVTGDRISRKLRILCLHGFRQNASSFKGRTSSLAKKFKNMVEFIYVDAPHELPFIYMPRSGERNSVNLINTPPEEKCRKRFAWLVTSDSNCSAMPVWKMADEPFDPLQYQQQTEGFEKSCAHLKTVFEQMGPFDGILGFSQGAAMAALFCQQHQNSSVTLEFKFVILFSGFPLINEVLSSNSEMIACPSLHVFGNVPGEDRQISCEASRELAGMFSKESSVTIEHNMGHIIPTRSPYIDQIREFLMRFL